MKKNVMLKIASVLMVAVLLTTCAISSTFAKYTSSATKSTGTARVANWGIDISTTTPSLFANEYVIGEKTYVKSSGTDMVVAPGSKNEDTSACSFGITVTGKPEVAFELSATINVSLNNWSVDNGTYYCPLIIKVNGEAVETDGITTAAGYEEAIEDKIASILFGKTMDENDGDTNVYTQEYAAATTEDFSTKSCYVTWEWPFESNNDVNDTKLGNNTTKGTISFDYTITATQISGAASATPKAPATQG